MDNELENEYFEDTAQARDGMSYRPEGDENGLLQEFRYTLDQITLTEGLTFVEEEDEEDEDPTYVPPAPSPVQAAGHAAPEPPAPSPQPPQAEARTPEEPQKKQSFFQRLFGS